MMEPHTGVIMKTNLKKIVAAAVLAGTAMSVFAAPKFKSRKHRQRNNGENSL